MSDRFYTDQPLGAGEFVLDGPEAHHLSAVRRFAPGDRVTLFNGDGFDYPAEVVAVGKKSVSLVVLDRVAVEREVGFPLIVASAVPKGDRGDYLIEKLTELGATRFVPLVTTRSVVQPKSDKFARAVIEASKQCGRSVLMAVDPPTEWCVFAARADLPPVKLILHPDGGVPITSVIGPYQSPERERRPNPPVARAPGFDNAGVVIAVGPEGGFDPDEVQLVLAHDWRPVTLGRRILRVETAATAAVAAVSTLYEK